MNRNLLAHDYEGLKSKIKGLFTESSQSKSRRKSGATVESRRFPFVRSSLSIDSLS